MELAKRGKLLLISLGYNCHVKEYINMYGENTDQAFLRQPFDWIGCPMWAICDIVKNDFKGLTDKENLILRKRFEDKDTEFLTNINYNCVFVHDYGKDLTAIPDELFQKVDEDYKRRVARFYKSLELNILKLFIRQEQVPQKRIKYPEYELKEENELVCLKLFSQMMKEKNISFTILYLTTTEETGYDEENRIYKIKYSNPENKLLSGVDIGNLIKPHIHLIKKYFALV